MSAISRRSLISLSLSVAASSLTGCAGSLSGTPLFGVISDGSMSRQGRSGSILSKPNYQVVYASYRGEPAPVEAFDYAKVDRAYLR